MKKLIFLLILLPTVAFSQEALQKSAETFVANYFKLFEGKKYDEILTLISDDGLIISPNHSVRSLKEALKTAFENNKTTLTSDKFDVESLSADVLSPTSALVTAMYLRTIDRSGNVSITDNLDIYLLEMKEGSWKFKKIIGQNNFPVIFSENVDKKFQTGKVGPLPRLNGAVGQMWSMFLYFIEDYKKNGTSTAEAGKKMGSRFAKYWNQSRGFEGLVSGIIWNLQTISTYIEILERNESTLKVKYDPSIPLSDMWNITEQDVLECFQNSIGEIAAWMGGTCSIVDDGKYWIITLNKK